MFCEEKHRIWAKTAIGLSLTPRERAFYLLFGSDKEVKDFLKKEKAKKEKQNG